MIGDSSTHEAPPIDDAVERQPLARVARRSAHADGHLVDGDDPLDRRAVDAPAPRSGASSTSDSTDRRVRSSAKVSSVVPSANSTSTQAPSAYAPMPTAPTAASAISTFMSSEPRRSAATAARAIGQPPTAIDEQVQRLGDDPRRARPGRATTATARTTIAATVETARRSRRQNGGLRVARRPRRPAVRGNPRARHGRQHALRPARRPTAPASPAPNDTSAASTPVERRRRRARPSARTPRSPCPRRGSATAVAARPARRRLRRRRAPAGSRAARSGGAACDGPAPSDRRRRARRPASVSAYMTILPSRRERTSPAVRRSAHVMRDEVLRALDDPGQVADAQLVRRPAAPARS